MIGRKNWLQSAIRRERARLIQASTDEWNGVSHHPQSRHNSMDSAMDASDILSRIELSRYGKVPSSNHSHPIMSL